MNRRFPLCLALTLALSLAAAVTSALEKPGDVDPRPEQKTLSGTVEAAFADDFETGSSEKLYHLVTDEGERVPLTFAKGTDPGFKTGDRLRLTGRTLDNRQFAVESSEVEAKPSSGSAPGLESPAAASSFTTGPKKVLLIRYNFANDTSQPYTDAQAQATMFGSSGSVAAFYAEGSYGLTTQTGSITPWLTVPVNKPTTCDISSSNQASTLAKAAGYDPASYNFVVWVFPHLPCGWSGLGVVGGSGAWINQALSTYVVAHELGHNYGLLHAHSWDCGSTAIGPSCVRSEYGDPFDTMGGSLRQFNSYGKASILGWLSGGSIATRSAGSGTYTLSPLESGAGVRALQLPTSVSGRTYWVEFRQAIGFDAGLSSNANVMNGALIHLGPSAVSGTDLLDMTPGTSGFGDAALDVGDAFTDATAGLTITVLAKNGSTLDVRADFVPVLPIATFNFLPVNPTPGQAVTFTDTSSGPPTVWNWNFGDGNTSTSQNPTHTYSVGGQYTITLTASNSVGTSAPVSQSIIVGTPPPKLTALTASPVLPQAFGTAITWTATATGGTAPLQYRFYRADAGAWVMVQDYGTNNKFAWTPGPGDVGQHQVAVWVKSAGSAAAYEDVRSTAAFQITSPVAITSLTESPASPSLVGQAITWTATATGAGTLQYRFWRFDGSGWSMVRDYSTTKTYSWTPGATDVGPHSLAVWVKRSTSTYSWEAVASVNFSIVSSVTITALNVSPAPPELYGTPITWTAVANGSPGPLQYRFYRYDAGSWKLAQDYSTNNTYSWTPGSADVGTHDVAVWVKASGSPAAFDAVRDGGMFDVVSVKIFSLVASPTLPRPAGTPITWSASASGVGPLQYRFWRYDGGIWKLVQDYGASNLYAWTPGPADVGIHYMAVWVRTTSSAAAYDAIASTAAFTITP